MQFTAEQFSQLGHQSFDRRLLALLREHCPQATQGQQDADVRQRIHAMLRQAQQWGLDDERSAATFVVAGFQLGEGFDQRIPALRQVLQSSMAPGAKAQALSDFTVALFARIAREEQARAAASAGPR